MAKYSVNPDAVAQAEHLIDRRQYVLDSDWGAVQPRASDQNTYLTGQVVTVDGGVTVTF